MSTARRLEPLLNLHRLRRRVLKQLLAALRAQQAELADRLRALGEEWAKVRQWSCDALAREARADEARLAEQWAHGAELQSDDLNQRMGDLQTQALDAEKRLIRASQELKMLATLQERRLIRERAEAARKEQVNLDEMKRQPMELSQ
jgi:flagellar export protein FliJ